MFSTIISIFMFIWLGFLVAVTAMIVFKLLRYLIKGSHKSTK